MSEPTKPKGIQAREFWIDNEQIAEHYDGLSTLELTPDDDKKHLFTHVLEAAPVLARIKELEAELETVRTIGVEMQREANRKLSAENDRLRSALEFECGGRCHPEHNPCNAREALGAKGE